MRTLRVGLIGCGVVGEGVLRLLAENAATLVARLGAPIEVTRIAVRDPAKSRSDRVPRDRLTTDVGSIVDAPDVDVVVEVMGGVEPAASYVRRAIERRKHVVTANKALLAEHGNALLELAESAGVDLYFEASVGGGIPIIRVLREALASDRVVSLRGIVNGTSNYILSRMTDEGTEFDAALRGAQDAGFAEADATLDLSGGDAAHKLTILATLAFGARLAPSQILTEGIETVSATDILCARRFGYVLKPLAVARARSDGALELRVHPALVPARSVLASVSGAMNAVVVEGAALGPCLLSGQGAGSLPTAMSVVSDLVDVGRNLLVGAHGRVPSRSFRGESLTARAVAPPGELVSRYYLRFSVLDRPGVLARIAGALGACEVSIEQMVQEGRGRSDDQVVSIVMLTHEAREQAVRWALREIAAVPAVVEPPRLFRIEEPSP